MQIFLSVITHGSRIDDLEAKEVQHLQEALEAARASARKIMATAVRKGDRIPYTWRMLVTDSDGRIQAALTFGDVADDEIRYALAA
jgi:hypothetical protein